MKWDTLRAGPTKRYLKVGSPRRRGYSQSAERSTGLGASLRAALEDVPLSPHEQGAMNGDYYDQNESKRL